MRIYGKCALGAEAGLLAGGGVALLFLLQDVIILTPLATPSVLAADLFGPASVREDLGVLARVAGLAGMGTRLLAVTVLHFLTFAVLGAAGAFVVRRESWPSALVSGALFGLVVFTGVFYVARVAVAGPVVLGEIGVPAVLVANTIAGVILGSALHFGGFGRGSETGEAPAPTVERASG